MPGSLHPLSIRSSTVTISSPSQPRPPSTLRRTLRWLSGLCLGLALGAGLGGGYLLHTLWQQMPPIDHLADYDPALPMRIHARDGTLLAEFGQERRELVPIERIPPLLRHALLSIEDERFHEHRGVDFIGLARAAWRNAIQGAHAQGGSTITMQVARAFFLSREKTYSRKLMEVLLAFRLEATYNKDKLLELYMNQIYLGERAYGFAAAASVYFDKTLDALTPAESALLAGLPKAPSAYNPLVNPERAVARQRLVLQRMHALGHLDEEGLRSALAEPLKLRQRTSSVDPSAAYAVEQARKMMVAEFGDEAYARGLDVVTTISLPEQRAASHALRRGLVAAQRTRGHSGPEGWVEGFAPTDDPAALRSMLAPFRDSGALRAAVVVQASPSTGITAWLRDGTVVRIPLQRLPASARAMLDAKPPRPRIAPGAVIRVVASDEETSRRRWDLSQRPDIEGALVSIDAHSGEILALTGGFDFAFGKFDHAVQALRQPGSTFKPFVFSAALEKGYFPGTLIDDTQREVVAATRGRKAWRPRNYGDNYEGFISARRGLVRSKNMVAINLMEAAGVDYVQQFSLRFGFEPEHTPAGLPLALGAGAVSPLQLTQAYAVFANGGELVQPRLVSRVSDRGGRVLFEARAASPRASVISPRNAHVMDSLLRDVVRHGTARRAASLGRADVAGKTGTSNDARDVWFAGYSSGIASVVWMGHSQPRSLGRATGGTLALPVWVDYMKVALRERAPSERPLPEGLVQFEGDYVYAEHLQGTCVADTSPRTESPFECRLTAGAPDDGPGPTSSLELQLDAAMSPAG